MRTASVVLVEDSAPYATLVSLLLADAVPGGVEVRHHERLVDAVADLRAREADCVLLDLSLPDSQQLEGLAALAAAGVRSPIIVLSGHDDDELAVAAIAAGAQDYLVKGQERPPARFVRAIRFAIERRRAQERGEDLLRAREDRWRTLTHLAPVGIVEAEADGRLIFVNDWMTELTGRPLVDLMAFGWRQAVHAEDLALLDETFTAALDGPGDFALELRWVRPDGEVVWAHLTAVLLRDPWDGPAGWLGTLVDVTAAHRAREDLAAVAELARDASVNDSDPVPPLLAGGRALLGAETLALLEPGATARGLLEAVRRGDVELGVLQAVWPDGREPAPRDATIVRLLASEVGAALERQRLVEQLRDLARTDPLTGLANRRLWDERLRVELARAARYGRPLCVAVLDLDHFKAYNDRHGHHAGDALLREMTAEWREALRGADLLARWGGDEFALLLPDCDLACARTIVGRLAQLTHAEIGCSAGLVRWTPPDEDGAQLLARADAALYAAKGAGRGGIAVG